MTSIYKIYILLLFLCFTLVVASCDQTQTKTSIVFDSLSTTKSVKPYIDSVNYYRNIIERDQNLQQHFTAIKYQDTNLTPESAIRFMVECNLNDIDINLGVALKETGMTAGTARTANNLHGLKKARQRFSWACGWTGSNYCEFQNPYFSFLEMNEYLMNGSRVWSSHSIPAKYIQLIDSLTFNYKK